MPRFCWLVGGKPGKPEITKMGTDWPFPQFQQDDEVKENFTILIFLLSTWYLPVSESGLSSALKSQFSKSSLVTG
jgi:hypothetical protein